MCGIVAAQPSYASLTEETDAGALLGALPAPPASVDGMAADVRLAERTLEALVQGVEAARTRFTAPVAVSPLIRDDELRATASARCRGILSWCEAMDAALGSIADQVALERLQGCVLRLKDVVWAILNDNIGGCARARALCASLPGRRAALSYNGIATVFDALDRLEVRGRDSAGVTVWISLSDVDRAALNETSARSDLLFRNKSQVFIRRGVCFAYKRASVIGRLGENTAELRRAVRDDVDLQAALALPSASVTVLGHTRWASVGRISQANAHPVDSRIPGTTDGPFSVASLNGDIDNHADLSVAYGTNISSEITTDAKIIPVSMATRTAQRQAPVEALVGALAEMEGSMAIAAQSEADADRVLLAVKGSGQGLYVGFSPQGFLVASEVYGLVALTDQYLRLDGGAFPGAARAGTVVALRREGDGAGPGIERFDGDGLGRPIDDAEIRTAEVTSRDLTRGSFDHYLEKELAEASASFAKTLRGRVNARGEDLVVALPEASVPQAVREGIRAGHITDVVVIGQGTAAVAARGIAELMDWLFDGRLRVTATPGTEFSIWGLSRNMSKTCVIAVSQSGSTTDTNRSVTLARERGATILSIVNRRDSDLATKSDGVVYTSDGRDVEMSVASTKAFYAQVAAGALLGLQLAKEANALRPGRETIVLRALRAIPEQLAQLHRGREDYRRVADEVATRYGHWAVVGSGPNRVAAEEIRIKLSELCYKTVSTDAVEDKKHIDLSAEALVVVCVAGAPPHQVSDLVKEVAILTAHMNEPIVLCTAGSESLWPSRFVLPVPRTRPELGWILTTAAGHLLAYSFAKAIDAAATPVRDAIAELERAADMGRAPEAGPPKTVLGKIGSFLAGVAAGELQGVLSSRSALQLGREVLPPPPRGIPGGLFFEDRSDGDATGRVRRALYEALDELARPIDTVRHQAKTVTVGTSRTDADLGENELVMAIEEAGADTSNLPVTAERALRSYSKVIGRATGVTRYQVDADAIRVVKKTGSAVELTSRAADGAPLRGSKRRVVELGEARLLRGRFDGRIVVLVPELETGCVRYLSAVHVELLPHVTIDALLPALEVGDRLAELRASVTETCLDFDVADLARFSPADALLSPIEDLAERIVAERGAGSTLAPGDEG